MKKIILTVLAVLTFSMVSCSTPVSAPIDVAIPKPVTIPLPNVPYDITLPLTGRFAITVPGPGVKVRPLPNHDSEKVERFRRQCRDNHDGWYMCEHGLVRFCGKSKSGFDIMQTITSATINGNRVWQELAIIELVEGRYAFMLNQACRHTPLDPGQDIELPVYLIEPNTDLGPTKG